MAGGEPSHGNGGRAAGVPEVPMVEISQLKSLGGRHVNVHLADGSAYAGRLRTDLLSDNSISIFLDDGAEGTTLYIDEIVSAVAAEVR